MENCCDSLFKTLLLIFNLAFALVGLVLIGFGVYVQVGAKDYLNFLSDNYLNTPVFIIILGAVIFLIAFFGCCGASRESKCMMYMYGFLLFIILIAQVTGLSVRVLLTESFIQIGAGIAAFALKGDLDDAIKTNMETGMSNYMEPGHEGVTATWDLVQDNLKCCGVEGMEDWKSVPSLNGSYPDSCCVGGTVKDCGKQSQDTSKFNNKGCFKTFTDFFRDNLNYVGGKTTLVDSRVFTLYSSHRLLCCRRRGGGDQPGLLPRQEDGHQSGVRVRLSRLSQVFKCHFLRYPNYSIRIDLSYKINLNKYSISNLA